MLTVTKIFQFDSSHQLKHYNGKCANLHGHRWYLRVTVAGEIRKESGMILDFKTLSTMVETLVIDDFDHNHINDILELDDPTAEIMTMEIVKRLEDKMLPLGCKLVQVRLYETEESYVEWTRGCHE